MSEIESRAKIEKRIKVREMWLKSLSVLALLIMVAGLGLFIYFQTSYQTRIQLDNPANVRVEKLGDNVYLKFDKVKNASAYRYSIDNNVVQVGADDLNIDITNLVESPKKYAISVQAIADNGFKNSDVIFADDFVVTKTLAQPIAEIDKYDAKLVWVQVDGADMYEVTIIENADISTATTAIVSKTEFDISDVVVDYTKNYSFSVKAIAENEFINQSPSSVAVEHSLKGRLNAPTNLIYSQADKKLAWDAVENAQTYTVVLSHGNLEPKKFSPISSNYIYFSAQDVDDIGEYEVYVYANNVQSQGLDEEVIWYLASENSETLTFDVYQQLSMPNGLRYQMNGELVWFSWDAVPHAYSYTVELVNGEGTTFFQKNTTANEINLRRDLEDAIGGDFRIRVKANGYGYYLTSDFSAVLELNVLDQFAPVQNIEVLENGKYLTFTAIAQNVVGDVKFAPKNGYTVVILDENDNEIYNEVVYDTILDTSAIFTQPTTYKIAITVNACGYFRASEETTAEYSHQIVLNTPTNVALYKRSIGETNTMIFSFSGDYRASDYVLWFDGVEYANIVTNPDYSQFVTSTVDDENQTVAFEVDISSLYASIFEFEPLTVAKKYSAKVKCVGNVTDEVATAGYKDSKFSAVAMFENKIKLQTPRFVMVDNVDEESVLLYFTQVENATNYLISIESEVSGAISIMTSRLTTCDIYSIISAGKNKIVLTAVGVGYYENSDPSKAEEYDYTPILKAPNDVEVTEQTLDDGVHYYATFTTTRFAEYYKVEIRKTHELQTVDGTKQVVELANASFEVLSTKFSKGTVKTNCDITEYLESKGFGKYEVRVRAVLEQPEVTETPIIYSSYSNVAEYAYFDKQPTPTNLAFNNETKVLTFTGAETALNGYTIRVSIEQNDGSFVSNDIIVNEERADLSTTIASLGGVGKFTISAMTRKVEELFLGNSAWSTPVTAEIRIKLADPTNFKYDDVLQEVSWTSDVRMEFEYLKLTFRNKAITYTLIEVTDDSFKLSVVNLREYIKVYGDGFYDFEVQSFSHKNMVDPSQLVTYTYTKYVQLDSPVLISVIGRNNRVEAKFATSNNAKSYAIVAKLPTENVWTKIKTGIADNGEAEITVDIKTELSAFKGANKYDIAVVAETYDYFLESEPSNSLPYELWLKFTPPANLTVENVDGKYYAVWDVVPYAETYSFSVDEHLIANDVTENRFDLTEVIGDRTTGKFLLGVRVNATGYYYDSLYTTYDFYLTHALAAPTITFDQETHKLTIIGQGDGTGYTLDIEYYESESALSGSATKSLVYENIQSTIINLTNTMEITGLGIYKIKVKELGDGVYWDDSDWSNELTVFYTVKLDALVSLNVDKRKNENGQIENYIVITKPEGAIYESALIKYAFYEIDSIDSDIEEGQEAVLQIISKQTEFKIEGLANAKYYKVVATILGAFDSVQDYKDSTELSDTERAAAIRDLAYYNNSDEKTVNMSTLGSELSAPIIEKITMTESKNLEIIFSKVLNAEDYTLLVTRQSKGAIIYNAVINVENVNAQIGADSIIVTFSAMIDEFTDEYDIYNIKLCANEVLGENGEVVYAKSPNTEYDFEWTVALSAPTVEFIKQVDGSLRIQVSNIAFATGYELELKINSFTQTYTLNTDAYIDFSSPQYGAYTARAKALGDTYHKDSDWGESEDYYNRMELGGVEWVEIISNGDVATLATRIYAQWNEVEGAKMYGVKVEKDGAFVGEYTTNKTYFDLINLFKDPNNGYGTYTVWAKTNGDGAYITGESTYTKYATYRYKGQFEVPLGLEIVYEYNIDEYPTTLSYYAKFGQVSGAEKYIIKFYSNDEAKTEIKTIELSVNDLDISNGNCTADITDVLKYIDGGVYLATIKVAETRSSLESAESEPYEFTNYHIHDDPSLSASQIGNTPFVRLRFSEISTASLYSLRINSQLYLENGETFAYSSGYIDINAKFLNIGGKNLFVLRIVGDLGAYYLDTYYSTAMSNFTFKLQNVEDILIEQDDKTQIADGTNYHIWLSFRQVDFATSYELWIDNAKVSTLPAGQEKYDISALFQNKMPKDDYEIRLIATDSVYGLSNSDSTLYKFDYTLQFSAPTSFVLSDSGTNLIASWSAPQKFEAFSALASANRVTLGVQTYKIVVYYILDGEEILAEEIPDINTMTRDLTDIVCEAGAWRIYVYASANGAFDESKDAAIETYDVVVKLDAVKNLRIYESGDKVLLDFDKVTELNYTFASGYLKNLYYEVYLNNGSIVKIAHSSSTTGIDITKHLWGGDNIVYVITRNNDTEHFIDSSQSDDAEYNYDTAFIALTNATIYHNDQRNKQFFRFDDFEVNGMTSDEILNLTYTLTFYNEAGEQISTYDKYVATRYDSTTLEIDVTSVINSKPGAYTVIAKINGYQKTFTVNSKTVHFVMKESKEVTITYDHKLRAETLALSLLVIDTEGKERVSDEGLEMQEMWLTFDVKFAETYINRASEFTYVLLINQREYYLTLPFSNELIGEMVTASGYMTGGTAQVNVTTRVKISERTEGGERKISLTFSLVELLQADGFNIYMTGAISIKAKSAEQGYYLESTYQTNFLRYDYYLRYMTPTGLEFVERDDGKHYIKWDEPSHPHIRDYYSIVDAYNVTIISEGVVGETGVVTDPNKTKGGKHSQDFTPDKIIAENGFLYYEVEDLLFAGHNTISLKCNASPTRYYLESGTDTITNQAYSKKINTPTFDVQDLEINLTGNDTAKKGVEIVITNVDNVVDYDQELRKVINYNVDAIYRLTITGQSECKSDTINPNDKTYMNYVVDFKVGKSGIYDMLSGTALYNKVSFAYSDNKGKLHIIWQFAEPGRYTYTVTALGNANNYTLDSDAQTLDHDTFYCAPSLSVAVKVYDNESGSEQVRQATATTRMSKIVLEWQTELSKFYNAEYQLDIVGLYNRGASLVIPTVNIQNKTSITFSSTENAEIFDRIMKRPANYTFTLKSMAKTGAAAADSDEIITYYLESAGQQLIYNYIVKINTPSDLSVVEIDGSEYIKVKIPQYFEDAGIEKNIQQIFVAYKITQVDPSFNLGANQRQLYNEDTKAPVKLGEKVVGENDGYYYIDITGKLYPSNNKINIYFNSISEQNFAQSDESEFIYNYIITLAQVKSALITNVYDKNGYVAGFTFSFENVQYNKYFAYRLDIVGTEYNSNYKKSLLLKADPSAYVAGSASNYSIVRCYEIEYGVNSIAGQKIVTANDLYTRSVSGGSYSYSQFRYVPCENSTSYSNTLTFLALIDGGLPDKYSIAITSLGELDREGNANALLRDLPIASATKSSQPFDFSYIMKGTLVPADLSIGISQSGTFNEATANSSSNVVAYIYNNDNKDDSFAYLHYTIGQSTAGLQSMSGNVVLRAYLQDSQAQKYYLYYKNIRDSKTDKIEILKWQGSYIASTNGVVVTYDATKQKFVAYIDLITVGDGILKKNANYQLYVSAYNDSKITNAQNKEEYIYDSTEINSVSRYASRFDKVVKPNVTYDSGSRRFVIANFSRIENIVNMQLGNSPYNFVVNLSQNGSNTTTMSIASGTITTRRSDVVPYKMGTTLYIPYDFVKKELDERGYSVGETEIKMYVDVEERGYIWDSDYSDEISFAYKAYIGFPNFAITESEYYGGQYATTGNRSHVYSEYEFNNSSELARTIMSRYTLNTTAYVARQNWSLLIEVEYYGNSKTTTINVVSGQNNDLTVFYRRNAKNATGMIGDLLGGSPSYGSYDFSMRILGVYDRYENLVSSDIVEFDESSYSRTFDVKYKLFKPQYAELVLNDSESEIECLNVSYRSDSVVQRLYNSSRMYYSIERGSRREKSGSVGLSYKTVRYGSTVTFSGVKNSGTYTALVCISSDNDYIFDSDDYETNSVFIPFVPGIKTATIKVSSTNEVTLKIEVGKLTDPDGVKFESSTLSAGSFEFELELINAATGISTGKTYTGTVTDIQAQLNADFSRLMSNTTGTTFAPGAYYCKVKTTNNPVIGGYTYKESAEFYVNEATCYRSNNQSSLQSRASDCKYTVAYSNWNKNTSFDVLRTSNTFKGLVTGGRINPILDGGDVALNFVQYRSVAKDHTTKEVVISSSDNMVSNSNRKELLFSTVSPSNWPDEFVLGTYSSATQTKSNEKWDMYLFIRLDETVLNNKFGALSFKSGKTIKDYIVLPSNAAKETWGTQEYVVYAGPSNVAKRQRLAPTLSLTARSSDVYSKWGDWKHNGYDYYAEWTQGNDVNNIDKTIVRYYCYFSKNNNGKIEDPLYKSGIEGVTTVGVGAGVQAAILIWKKYHFAHKLSNVRGDHNVSAGDTNCKMYLGDLEERYYDGVLGITGFERRSLWAIWLTTKVMSNTTEYDDSAVVQADNWGSVDPFKDYPSCEDIPSYEE